MINNCDNVHEDDWLEIKSLKLQIAPGSLLDSKIKMTALNFYPMNFLGPAWFVNSVGCYPFTLGYCGMDLEESKTNVQRMSVKSKEQKIGSRKK